MNQDEILKKLQDISSSDDFIGESAKLAEEWSNAPDGLEAVEPVLRFIESNPSLDFGMPGPLVHFVESFFGGSYEQKLVDSVNRKPTVHNLWMLNRVINGTKAFDQRKLLIETLSRAKDNPLADFNTQQQAIRFLTRLLSLDKPQR